MKLANNGDKLDIIYHADGTASIKVNGTSIEKVRSLEISTPRDDVVTVKLTLMPSQIYIGSDE